MWSKVRVVRWFIAQYEARCYHLALSCVPKTDSMQVSVKLEVNLRGFYCLRLFIKMIKVN